MQKALKIIKIDLLALLAIPLLLLATFFKLLAKAFEKITIFLGLALVATVIIVLLSTATTPKNIGELIIGFLLVSVCIGVVMFFVGWGFALISGLAIAAWNIIISVFDTLYELTYNWYLSLFTSCEADYKILSLNGKTVPNAFACIFYTILKGLSWLITTIVSLSYGIAGVFSFGLVLLTLLDLNKNVKDAFGLNIFQYMSMSPLHSVIFGILIYLIMIGVIIIGVMALASEWYEWGQELKMTGQEISDEITDLVKNELKMATGSSEEVAQNLTYLQKLEEHLGGLEALGQEVTSVLEQKDSPLLRSYWGIYMRNLDPLVEECSAKKSIEVSRFKQLIPQIQLLDKQRDDVQKLADKLKAELLNPTGASVFFAGCNSLEKLEKRYKALCKTYHPDMAEGDTETFQKMQAEYKVLKASMMPQGNVQTK
ncbi:MAG: J domain-containing protein [Lachnospiraceae bacterium]|nr:J domain-containing protein [Lachnospiraceae bacterium]